MTTKFVMQKIVKLEEENKKLKSQILNLMHKRGRMIAAVSVYRTALVRIEQILNVKLFSGAEEAKAIATEALNSKAPLRYLKMLVRFKKEVATIPDLKRAIKVAALGGFITGTLVISGIYLIMM